MSTRDVTVIGAHGKEMTVTFDDGQVVRVVDDGHLVFDAKVQDLSERLERICERAREELPTDEYVEFLNYAKAMLEEWK